MPDRPYARSSLLLQAPIIKSEMKLNFNELFQTNRSIVDLVLQADENVLSKTAMLERLLPGLSAAGDCACSCACQCSCSCS
jgi:hypothetical protein